MKFYYYAILSITYLWGVVVAHRDASIRRMDGLETGEFSVAILGFDNIAPGKFCNVNGGKGNVAGLFNDYAIIGGGVDNDAGAIFSTITGGRENLIEREVETHSTISGGDNNVINISISSVITGGTENRMLGDRANFACTISGGTNNTCSTDIGVATGLFNAANNVAAVAFGGAANEVNGQSATSVGGEDRTINGDFSIGLGKITNVNNDSSMVINLAVSRSEESEVFISDTDVDGQFLVNAESFTFQIGKNRDDLRFQITEDNIQNLITALENAA
ncbi:hypothetical protein FRACYDRAFT_254812 [Fragilariopsis cylindrus CCMP1102]|uniref:Trimeric autotransporter adhesin YadA-like head domain-containing protein n=1 Tax=Fragilariopsis cylindrus CCMP1102 TaxID=635003 RepID=A0A1E7EKG7_9STRA|nr:hypothetical protein FRACYDRAFT_254812 [Fragilariopsis cylindrus CCMP1102]|eukprot:OEU06367.1 hypothetical protein FRACYDRAFT_254812 [Fragilariopsis cylindrus CCMP1102]